MEGLRSIEHRIEPRGRDTDPGGPARLRDLPVAPARQTVDQLLHAIRRDIIPRLLVSHPGAPRAAGALAFCGARPTREEVVRLAELVLHPDSDEAFALVLAVAARGVGVELLFSELLAPAARRLGHQWEDDERDFTQVTFGLARLHSLLTRLAHDLGGDGGDEPAGLSILLAPTPGDQHSFGIAILAEFFRRRGWSVGGGPGLSDGEVLREVRRRRYGMVGLSLYIDSGLEALIRIVREIKAASVNRDIGILVGGHVFAQRPDLVQRTGAHATALDAFAAVERAEFLVGGRARAA